MEVFPKKVHLAFVVDPAVPTEVVCPDDLKVFRSSIALLTSACERTEQGFVRFRVYKKMSSTTHQSMLVFECEDTGRDVELDQYHHLFQTPKHDNKNGSESSVADDDNDDDQECITVDPETGAMLPKAVCQIKKSPVSNGFAVYPVARYVQVCLLAAFVFVASGLKTTPHIFVLLVLSVHGRRIWLHATCCSFNQSLGKCPRHWFLILV